MNTSRRARLLSVPFTGFVVLTLGVSGCSSETPNEEATQTPTATSSEGPAASGSAAGAGTTEDAAAASAAWLAAAAAEPAAFENEYDGVVYTDDGLRADVVLSLLAAGDTATAITLAEPLTDPAAVSVYVGDGQSALYAGSTAKLAAVLTALGQDPRAVGERDLVAELEARQAPSGRFTDLGEDYSQTISQSWAVLALSAVDEAPAAAVEFLATQQCASGGFPAQLSDAPTGDCDADVDATGFALSALSAANGDAATVEAALAWLADTAGDEGGSWAAAGGTEPSVNSTSVVAAALADVGEDATPALEWLAGQSITEGADAGAFPLAAGDEAGDVRATAQAVLALSGSGLAQVLGAQA